MLAALAGASAWLSLGVMAVVDPANGARVAALPPVWLLGTLMAAAAGMAWMVRLPLHRAWPLAIAGLVWLPFVPGRVPDAFLMWHGPLEAAVWFAVAAGLVFGGPAGWARGVAVVGGNPKRAPWLAGVLAAACYGAGAVHIAERIPNGDEPHYLVITQSLLLDHDLRIQNNHERGDYTSYFQGELRPHYLRRGTDGQIYSVHAPGISLLVLPGFALAGYSGAVATVIVCTAVASVLAWQVSWLLTASALSAWIAWASVFLTTPYFFHGFTIYPDGPGGMLTMIGVWLLVQLALARPVSGVALVLTGASLSALPWFHTRFAVLAGVLGLLIGLRLSAGPGGAGRLLRFATAPVLSVCAWLGFFWIIWGVPDPAAPYGGNTQLAVGQIWRGASGLLFDQQFGVIASAPIYAVALAGIAALARRHLRLAIELVLIVGAYGAAASSYAMWWGGVSAPARFVAAVLPVLAVPIAWWWRSRPSVPARALTLILLSASVLGVVPRVEVEHGAMVYNDRNGYDLLLDWAARSVNLPMAVPSVHRGALSGAQADAAVWLGFGLCVAAVAWILAWRRVQRPAAVWTALSLTTAAAVMGASTVVWARHGVAGVTPDSSQLTFLRSWNPDWQSARFLLRPLGPLSVAALSSRIEVATTTRGARSTVPGELFGASALPAADYEVVTDGARNASGELAVRIGRTDQLTERWSLSDRPSGLTGLLLRLPVAVHSVVVRGDGDAQASVSKLTLRLKQLRRSAMADVPYALKAARYGRVRVFFMDAAAFVEPAGFWTRGAEATTLVMDTDDAPAPGGLTINLRSGPVPASVAVSAGDWSRSLTFAPNERREVVLPPPAGQSWVVTIATGAKFSPRDLDPRNKDFRRLGVWVDFPQ